MLKEANEIKALADELGVPFICYGAKAETMQQTSAEEWDTFRNKLIDVVTQLQTKIEQAKTKTTALRAHTSRLTDEETQLSATVKKLLRENDASYCSPSAFGSDW